MRYAWRDALMAAFRASESVSVSGLRDCLSSCRRYRNSPVLMPWRLPARTAVPLCVIVAKRGSPLFWATEYCPGRCLPCGGSGYRISPLSRRQGRWSPATPPASATGFFPGRDGHLAIANPPAGLSLSPCRRGPLSPFPCERPGHLSRNLRKSDSSGPARTSHPEGAQYQLAASRYIHAFQIAEAGLREGKCVVL